MKYNVIKYGNHNVLVKKINSLLSEGWELHGNLCVVVDGSSFYYIQAVTLKEIKEKVYGDAKYD